MKKILIVIFYILLFLGGLPACAEQQNLKIQYDDYQKQPPYEEKRTVLTGGVSQVQELPSGMYGMWQVRGTLLETNDYSKYAQHSADIWVLQKDGNYVTLLNPQNGASATITVTSVQNNTATFVRTHRTYNSTDAEQVTITLQGDNFTGTDLILSRYTNFGVPIKTFARYRLNAIKISGNSLYNFNQRRNIHFGF